MFKKVLVANRGEIACRIIQTLRTLGIISVAAYSTADAGALHVTAADEAYLIGPATATESYLNVPRVLEAATASGAEAIHPGYGFLSEHADFARACREAGLVFIGPPTKAIETMGKKLNARRIMREAGVPVVPGTETPIHDAAAIRQAAVELGYPVMIKASCGGGGIGMQVVDKPEDLDRAIGTCEARARCYFGDGTVYLEKYIKHARHIEVQVIGDSFGRITTLGERECSIQRRHQKIVEESPSPVVDPDLRHRMEMASIRGARAINYTNAGTMEFILDQAGSFYFLEMNTRLQVEHPVTEMITGLDLVAEQLRIAAGEPCSFEMQPEMRGHSIECRIYAEDPVRMLPSPGTVTEATWPQMEGVRIDAGIRAGMTITPYYDHLLAKVVAWGETRKASLLRMLNALAAIRLVGVKTNIPVLKGILSHRDFAAGSFDTEFIATHDILRQHEHHTFASLA